MRIKKGDNVKILTGKDRGKTGEVLRSFPSEKKVLVENANQVKRHKKNSKKGQKSERVTISMPLNVSNVALICPKCSKATRVGKKIIEGKSVRTCEKCQTEI